MKVIELAMYMVVGAVLASAGVGVTDRQPYATLIAMAGASNINQVKP